MASLVMSWNIFNGFRDKEKTAQARMEKQKLQSRLAELEQQIRMQVREAFYNLKVALETVRSSAEMLNSRRQAFVIVSKKYQQGMVPQIEYIQAQNEYTRAGIRHVISRYDCRIMGARLERASAAYSLRKKEKKQ
jgi:outer membrane protein TolC